MEKAVFYHFLYFFFFFFFFLEHTFFLAPTVNVCDFKACNYLDSHFLLNGDVLPTYIQI